MVPQPLDKIKSAPGNGMASVASNPQHLVRGRAAGRARLRLTSRENDQISVLGKLQKKAPNTLKSLDAELKSAPALGSSSHPTPGGGQRSGRGGHGQGKKIEAEIFRLATP